MTDTRTDDAPAGDDTGVQGGSDTHGPLGDLEREALYGRDAQQDPAEREEREDAG